MLAVHRWQGRGQKIQVCAICIERESEIKKFRLNLQTKHKKQMKQYNLGFVADEEIYNHVKLTVLQYRRSISLKEFNKNIIDPIKLTFDSKIYCQTMAQTIESECIRQIDKTNNNRIGYFHQYLFKLAGNVRVGRSMLPPQLFEIDLADLHEQYPEDAKIVINPFTRKKNPDSSKLDDSKNVLVSIVPDKYIEPYTNQRAKAYFTGKKFPSTVKLNKLYYFMPYTKGKGIRDLYQIEVARVGTKHEFVETADENDFRLVFEIKFVKQLFDDYKSIKLMIWRSFTDTNLRSILAM